MHVAERLGNSTFEVPIMSNVPRAVPMPPAISPTSAASGFEVKSGPPPAPRRCGRNDALLDAMRSLAVGQWILVSEEKYKPHQVTSRVTRINAEGKVKLRQYSSSPGVRCVIREAE